MESSQSRPPRQNSTTESRELGHDRAIAGVINLLDPDVIVLGGGASQIPRLYKDVPARLKEYVFGREAATPVLPVKHGDASGVRGAAWLWPLG